MSRALYETSTCNCKQLWIPYCVVEFSSLDFLTGEELVDIMAMLGKMELLLEMAAQEGFMEYFVRQVSHFSGFIQIKRKINAYFLSPFFFICFISNLVGLFFLKF